MGLQESAYSAANAEADESSFQVNIFILYFPLILGPALGFYLWGVILTKTLPGRIHANPDPGPHEKRAKNQKIFSCRVSA